MYAVTGALGYSGMAITERLLAQGVRVRTLTNSPNRPNPFGAQLEIRPYTWDDAGAMVENLRGVEVLVNTYWVRFNHRLFTFDQAVRNTRMLIDAAKMAGVRRIVHVSILKPEQGRGLAYYEGKLALEESVRGSGMSWSILRPGVLFGRGDILVNNIAWVLRRLPVFGVFGNGEYKLQPMHVNDLAELAVDRAMGSGDEVVDAVGPETFTYRELVEAIGRIIGVRRRIVRVSPGFGYAVARMMGPAVGDVIITREEIEGLMRGLLFSDGTRVGRTKLTRWAAEHREELGKRYASEVGRRVRRDVAYGKV